MTANRRVEADALKRPLNMTLGLMGNRALLYAVLALCACSRPEPVPNRAESPEAAFLAARAGLKNRDLRTYFDALTESAARGTGWRFDPMLTSNEP